MRRSDRRRAGLLAVAAALALPALNAGSCVVPLDDEFAAGGSGGAGQGGAAPSKQDAAAPVSGCEPLQAGGSSLGLTGDLRSIAQSDGSSLWVADQATLPDGGTGPAAIAVGPGATADCAGWGATLTNPAFAPSPLAPSGLLTPLDLVSMPGGLGLYYELFVSDPTQTLGLRELGVGLAIRDPSSNLFVPTSDLLWSPDRPSYGTSVLVVGGTAYTFGCSSTGAFSASCFVARADAANLASTAGYTYWTGESWSDDVDDAAPITQASGTVSVRPDPTGELRYIMTFVPPLGDTLVAENAPAPEGPWSGPVTLAACDLTGAGAGSFCAGGQQHPELASSSRPLVLSYDARSFADAGAPADAFWPHLVVLALPAALP
jgi:hypothetical protein